MLSEVIVYFMDVRHALKQSPSSKACLRRSPGQSPRESQFYRLPFAIDHPPHESLSFPAVPLAGNSANVPNPTPSSLFASLFRILSRNQVQVLEGASHHLPGSQTMKSVKRVSKPGTTLNTCKLALPTKILD